MRIFNGVLIALTLLLLASCSDADSPVVTNERPIGTVESVKYTPESFSTWARTEITTSKGVFVVRGTRSVVLGDQVMLRTYSSGRAAICFESFETCAWLWRH